MVRPVTTLLLVLSLGCSSTIDSIDVDPSLAGKNSGRFDPLLAGAIAHEPSLAPTRVTQDVPSAIEPLPTQVDVDPAEAALGERLFADPRLSGDQRVSCADCHVLSRGGANGESHSSLPARSRPVALNVPSIFNLAFDFRFGWDGRYKTLEQQLDFAMGSAAAMHGSFAAAAASLAADGSVGRSFAGAFSAGLTADTLRAALVAYCRSAITPNARFDRYLRGELTLHEDEQAGYEAFRDYGCISCHQGINVGGNMLQRLGVMKPYFTGARSISQADLGRFNETHDERDRHVFRVPSLRNVARTAPYLHDGSAETLEQVVEVMARYQLGRELPAAESRQIVAFLRTLTGEYRGQPL
jgi:cytochrome c peroxidase